MKVKDAFKYIDKIDNEIKNLQKLLLLSEEDRKEMSENLGINSTIETIVNISVNSMMAYKNILKEKIYDADIFNNGSGDKYGL